MLLLLISFLPLLNSVVYLCNTDSVNQLCRSGNKAHAEP